MKILNGFGMGVLLATSSLATIAMSTPAVAQAGTGYDIAAGPLTSALNRFADESGIRLVYDANLVAGLWSPGLQGRFGVQEALSRLLAGTGLTYRQTGANAYTIEKAPVAASGTVQLGPVRVEGDGAGAAYSPPRQAVLGSLPPAYAGGQVARGGRVGMLGNQDFMETPFSQTSYTTEFIESQQTNHLPTLIAAVDPTIQQWGGEGTVYDNVAIRGFPVYSTDYAFNGLYGASLSSHAIAEVAERIEVLRGPSALLNGMPPGGNVGGTVNIIAKRAHDAPITRLTGSFADDSYFGLHADVGRRFGPDGAFGLRANVAWHKGDLAPDGHERENSTLSLGADFRTDRLRLSLDLMQFRDNYTGQFGSIYLGAGVTEVPDAPNPQQRFGEPWSWRWGLSRMMVTQGEFDLASNVTLYAGYSYGRNDFEAIRDDQVIQDNAGNIRTTGSGVYLSKIDRTSAEAGIRSTFSTGPLDHKLIINATYLNAKTYYPATGFIASVPVTSTASNLYNPVFSPRPNTGTLFDEKVDILATGQKLESIGIADTISAFDERLQLTIGVRRQRVVQDGYYDRFSRVSLSSYDESAVTPAFAGLFKINQKLSLYANYIEGLSAGSAAPSTATNAGEVFAPYRTKQGEVGIKVDLGQFATAVALFEITRPSAITDPVTLIYSVDGKQRNRGVELSVFGQPLQNLRIIGGATYVDATLSKTAGGVFEGHHAPVTPKWRGRLTAEWDAPWLPGFSLDANVSYTSSQFLANNNILSIPGYTIFGAGASFHTEIANTPLTVRARMDNLFNKAYWSANIYNGVGTPRTFRVSATVDF